MDQLGFRGIFKSRVGSDPGIREDTPDCTDRCIDERGDRMGDCVKADNVYFLLLLQDHIGVRAGEQYGQQDDDEQRHGDHRQQHSESE